MRDELAVTVDYLGSPAVRNEWGMRMPSALFVQKVDDGVKANGRPVEVAPHLSRWRFLS